MALHRKIGERLGFAAEDATFSGGRITAGDRSWGLTDAGAQVAEDGIAFGDFQKGYDLGTYAAHFAEVAVDAGPVAWLLTPLAAGASLVLCRQPSAEDLPRRAAAERVTATLGVRIEGVRELGRPG